MLHLVVVGGMVYCLWGIRLGVWWWGTRPVPVPLNDGRLMIWRGCCLLEQRMGIGGLPLRINNC